MGIVVRDQKDDESPLQIPDLFFDPWNICLLLMLTFQFSSDLYLDDEDEIGSVKDEIRLS